MKKFFKFATVGFIGYLVNAFFLHFISTKTNIEILAWALSTEIAIISNFLLNNLWTFRSERISGIAAYGRKFLQFNGSSVGALCIQAVLGTLGVMVFGSKYRELILPIIVVGVVMPYNWYMYNRFIWKRKNSAVDNSI